MRNRLSYYSFFLLIGLTGIVWYVVFTRHIQGNILTVSFLDIGQGDAILIEAPNGNQMLIDAGSNRRILSELGATLPFFDRFIDVTLATHPDKDHIGGFPPLFERYDIGVALDSGAVSDTNTFKTYIEYIEERNIIHTTVERGIRITLDTDVVATVLYPDGVFITPNDTNAGSVIVLLTYKDISFLFTGDAPQKIENYLAQQSDIDVDVLKLGHHGSKTSSSDLFLKATTPLYAVISAGKENRYGHPHQEVLDSITALRIPIVRTDTMGRLVFETDGTTLSLR